MKTKDLIKALQSLVKDNPSAANYEVAQQDCFSAPSAYTGTNTYVGTFFETEGGGFLNEEDVDDGEEVIDTFPVVVIESF